ncbi:MAG: cyclic nucleotide-binding domain-containing protein [Acidimicrobiia bacterium]
MARKSRNAYLEHLAKVPLFAGCSQAELRALARRTTDIPVPAGSVLVTEGHLGYEFFVIAEGRAKVSRAGRKVGELGAGDFFGELALLERVPRNATVTAISDMEAIVLTRADFDSALAEAPGMARKLMVGMARRLRELDAKV